MFHDIVLLLLSPYLNVMPVYSTRDMKSALIGKYYVCQKTGISEDSVKHVTGKIVSPWVVLWFHVLQNLHTTAFGEPYVQLPVVSAVLVRPGKLTSLDFGYPFQTLPV
jgi:hypothetical protein